ncbi:hypothetical protein G6F44_007697 [Rhizopus delemar]|nr:hypothetical protein G6F44_007697 [Rhizopus delemar]
MTDYPVNNEQRTYTEQEVFELLRRFKIEEQTTTQRAREERELPLEIASFLDETTKQQHQDNFKRYKREISKYYHEEWTMAEEINKSFIPKLKQFTVDTTQVVNANYKGAETSRLHGRAATEIFEQLLTIKSGGLSTEEANQLLDEALESAKRLAIHAWVQGRQQDEEAKDYAIRALRLPPSLKHLEAKESGSKREAFSEEFIARYNEANYQQRILKAAITNTSAGRGRGGYQSISTWNNPRGGRGFYGRAVTPTILTVQHQQTIQHRERPVSNATQITTLTTTTSINTIEPYYNLNNELHHSLRWHPTGQSPTTFSPLLENNNQSPLAPISNSKWLQDPIFQEADPMEESKEGDDSRRSTSYQRSNTEILGWRDDRDIPYTKSTIPLQVLYFTRKDEEKTNPGLPEIELIHPGRTFQDGRSSGTKRANRKRRLHLQNRSKGRIRSGSNARGLPRFPKFRERRSGLQIQIPCVRPQCSTKDFLQNHALCHRAFEERRDPNHLLFGRHLHPGEDKTRDEPIDNQSKTSSRETRLPHQLQKEYSHTIKNSGVSGFYIQQQDNADICTTIEDYQPDEEDPTVTYLFEENVQMDSRTTREDDFHDSSSGRGSITYKIPTTGPVEDITFDETELGSNLQIVKYQPSRVTLVGNFHNTEERPPNPKDSSRKPEDGHSCRCIKQWMGNQLGTDHSFRILEPGRENAFNKRTRAEDNFICDSAPRWKMRKLNNKNILGQQDRLKDLAIQIQELCNQHNIKPTEEAAIRINDSKKDVQLYTKKMGEAENRRLCSAPQPPAANVLDMVNRPSSFSCRCPATSMVTEGDVFISTLETDTLSTEKTSRTKGKAISSSDSIVAQPIPVPDDPKDETPTTTNHLENKPEMVSSRLAIINNSRLQDGLDEETVNFLNRKTRQSTQKICDNGWNHWTSWCRQQQPSCDPLDYDIKNLLRFLQDNKEYSSTHLNTLRSSIASVFSIIHSQKQPIADQPLIKDFFTAKRNSEVKIPSEQQLATWDVNILVEYIKMELSPTSGLSLVQLQLKTILLLCIATMWRPRSDIGRLQYHDVILKQDGTTTSILLHARTPKEGQVKSVTLGTIEDENVCPVRTAHQFILKTATIRQTLPKDQTFFLAYLDSTTKHPTSVRPTTVANWIKSAMDKAGIDTNNYQAHSIRAASSTKAVELGHSIKDYSH